MNKQITSTVENIIKDYNNNNIKYSILSKRIDDVKKAMEKLELERKEVFDELKEIRETELQLIEQLKSDPSFDMSAFTLEIQEISKKLNNTNEIK